ncbi:hypothetical protein ACFYOT_39515 [Saccharothrix saharensis]|uniref:hypothetical protein n=1 Tax=Saccharothrix saharensis TaxID=571190 RepID=UPI0036B47BC0
MSSVFVATVACASTQPGATVGSESADAKRPDSQARATVVIPPPQARGSVVSVVGTVEWAGRQPGCVVLELPSGQRFQLTGTAADDGERQARAGQRPSRQEIEATGHIPPVGAASCSPMRAFWVERLAMTGR